MKFKLKKIIILSAVLLCAVAARAFEKPVTGGDYRFAMQLFGNSNFTLAENIFSLFYVSRPESPLAGDALFMSAEALFKAGKFKEALDSYVSLAEKYPAKKNKYRKEIYFRVAECYFQLKDYESSEKYVSFLLKGYPNCYLVKDAYLLSGENKFLMEKYDEALSSLKMLDEYTGYRHFDYVYYLTGRIYYEKSLREPENKKRYAAEALKYFRRIEKEFSQSRVLNYAEFRKANVYYSLKNYKEAVDIIKTVIEKEEGEKFILLLHYFLGWNYYRLGEYGKAAEEYGFIISKYGDDLLSVWSKYKKGMCLEAMGREKEGLEQYNEVMSNHGGSIPAAYAKYAVAWHYYKKEKYYESLRRFERLTGQYGLKEINRAALFMTADIYIILGKFTKAREVFADIEKKYPADKHTAAYMQAWCLSKEGEFERSTQIYMEITGDENAPREFKARALLKIGDNYFEMDVPGSAERYYDMVVKNYAGMKGIVYEAYYAKGWALYGRNKNEAARGYFDRILKGSADHRLKARASFMKANTYYADFDVEKALESYLKIARDSGAPRDIRDESLFYAGWCYYRKKDFDRASEIWRKFASKAKDPVRRAEAYYRIGWAHFRKNDFEGAIKNFNTVIENYKNTHFYQEALLRTGDSYYNRQMYEKAVEFYRRLVDKYPSHYRVGEALYGIQWSYYQLGEEEKAIELSRQFVKKFPTSGFAPEILYRVGEHYYNTGKFDTAVSEFDKFITKYGGHKLADNAFYWQGTSYFNLRKYNEAITSFKELNGRFPDNPFKDRAVFKTGNAYYRLHEYKNAINHYSKFMEQFEGSKYADNALFNMALSYKRLDDAEKAKFYYKKLIKNHKDSEYFERAHMNLAYLYQDAGEYDTAIETFRKIIEMNGEKSGEAQFWIADCYYGKKDFAKAADEYMKVYKKYKSEERWAVTALDSAARMYEKTGKLKKAMSVYEKVPEVTKKKKYIDTARKKIELLERQYRILNPAPSKGETGADNNKKGGGK